MQNESPKFILIVEDEPIIANHIELVLTQAGYAVSHKVRSAAEAIEALAFQKPDLILLDVTIKGDTEE